MYSNVLKFYFLFALVFSFLSTNGQTCAAPSDVSALSLSANSAIVSWTENGDGTAWDIEVILEGETPTGTASAGYDDVTTLPFTIQGLSAETSYDVYVRTDCGMDNTTDVSSWDGPFSFTTSCAAFSINYFEPFSVLIDDIPVCWQQSSTGLPDEGGPTDIGFSSWSEDGFGNIGNSGAIRIRLNSDNDEDWLISPEISISSPGIQADFDFAITTGSSSFPTNLGSDDEVRFLISPDAGATWVTLQTWTQADNIDPTGENYVFDLSAYNGMDLVFAFWGYEGTVDDDESNDIFFDNFHVRTPPSCITPVSIEINAIGSINANLEWLPSELGETNWDVEFVELGDVITGSPTAGYDDITETSVTLTPLKPETSYEVYLRSDCGMDNSTDVSVWTGPFEFTTTCASFETPYLENFSDTPGPFGGFPICWLEANNGALADGPTDFGSSSWSVRDQFANAGDKSMRINLFNAGDIDWLISPTFNLEAGQEFQVEFDFAAVEFLTTNQTFLGSDDLFIFLVSSDSGASWSILQSWTSMDEIDPAGVKVIHDVSNLAGNEVQFAFFASEGVVDDPEDYEIFIDNFFVRNPPTCLEVTDVEINNIAPTSAIVSWFGVAPATSWDLEIVEANSENTGVPTTGYDDISNPAVILGLTPNTEYDIYVRSDCAMDNSTDLSEWTGPINFITPCDVDAPYAEFFDDFPVFCWNTFAEGDETTGPLADGPSNWTNNNGEGAVDLSIPGFFDENDWMVSPPINLNGLGYQVDFDISIVQAADNSEIGTLGSDDLVMFMMSTDFMETWQVLNTWTATTFLDSVVQDINHDLYNYASTSPVFAVWTSEGEIEDAQQTRIILDNFEITLAPVLPMAASAVETNLSCNGSEDGAIDLTLSGGQLPLTYLWSNGETTQDLTNIPAGEYSVTVTSSDGTELELQVSVSEPPAIEATTTVVNESVEGAADGMIDLTVSGGTAGYTFLWDNGATTEDIENLDDGTYCVTITDADNCTESICEEVLSGPVSNQNIPNLTSFRVYPNPVGNQKVIIDLEFSNTKDLEIKLINVFGQQVYTATHNDVSDLKTEVNVDKLTSGIYFIKVTDLASKQTIFHRLIKQ